MAKRGWRSQIRGSKQRRARFQPSTWTLMWIAGYLEGEGTFVGGLKPNGNLGGFTVEAASVDIEPLKLLLANLGGAIRSCTQPKGSFNEGSGYFKWYCTGARARGVMLTLYALLSQRRKEQIQHALFPAKLFNY